MTELSIPKGTRDFLPEEKILRDSVVEKLKKIFALYGYNPLETPGLENYETLASKYAGGAEILKEVYTLEDNAQRKLGLRYDLTVPFARVISMNPNLKKPFKRYQIDRVWRDGPIKLGRYREFWQCDADVVGIKSLQADAELLSMASKFYEEVGLEVSIFINNRKLLNSILDYANVPKEKQTEAILCIDKLKKIGVEGVRKELEEKGITDDSIARIISIFDKAEENNEETLGFLQRILDDKAGINEIKEILEYTKISGAKNIKLDISLARGLAYYTSTVFEVFTNDGKLSSSIGGGGRYDKIIGNLIDSKEEIPAVGISFGLDPICEALKLEGKIENKKSLVSVYVIPIKTSRECTEIVKELREEGINTDIDMSDKGVTKNLDFADKMGIKYSIIVGSNELKDKKVQLKNMISGEAKVLTLAAAIKELKKEVKLVS